MKIQAALIVIIALQALPASAYEGYYDVPNLFLTIQPHQFGLQESQRAYEEQLRREEQDRAFGAWLIKKNRTEPAHGTPCIQKGCVIKK